MGKWALIGFEPPYWDTGIGWDPEQGTAPRLAFLDRAAASDREQVFGLHLPWPGFGYVAIMIRARTLFPPW